jgi:taurine dioxygenase
MDFTTTKSPSKIGVEITNINLAEPLPEVYIKKIYELWVNNGVAIFRNQMLSHNAYADFAKQFGLFGTEPFIETMKSQPHIVELRRKASETSSPFGGTWHSDWSFQNAPPSATMLHSKIIPPIGGDTLFANTALAYKDLSKDLKEKIANLDGIHSAKLPYAKDGFYALENEKRTLKIKSSDKANKYNVHPLVRVHKSTRAKSLFINPVYTIGIDGMSDLKSSTLLTKLFEHMTQEKYIYRHKWQPDMLIMWDNRTVMHMAEGGYDGYERLMHRITLAGEEPIRI